MRIFAWIALFFLSQNTSALNPKAHPLNALEMMHYGAQRDHSRSNAPKNNFQTHHRLVFFFSNQCPHCLNFAPVLKQYSQDNHWVVEAISLNEQSLPEFPNAIIATQEFIDVAYLGKPVVYPALFLANSESKALYPISFGELSASELAERMSWAIKHVVAYEEAHP